MQSPMKPSYNLLRLNSVGTYSTFLQIARPRGGGDTSYLMVFHLFSLINSVPLAHSATAPPIRIVFLETSQKLRIIVVLVDDEWVSQLH